MKTLVVYAHPVETSFQSALHALVKDELAQAGHEVDDIDLYADGFHPVMSREERINYYDRSKDGEQVRDYIQRLRAAEALILCFPVWNYGFPAILKGYFDRVFVPDVSFKMVNDTATPCLHNIRRVVAVTSYGGNRLRAMLMGDPPRRIVTRQLRATIRPFSPVTYLAHYDTNHSTDAGRERFKSRVRSVIRSL